MSIHLNSLVGNFNLSIQTNKRTFNHKKTNSSLRLVQLLLKEGFILGYSVLNKVTIKVFLKF
jgi:ribosomal protein S8